MRWALVSIIFLVGCTRPDVEKECLSALTDSQADTLCQQYKKASDTDLDRAGRDCRWEKQKTTEAVEKLIREKSDLLERVTIFANAYGPDCRAEAKMVEQHRLYHACYKFVAEQRQRCGYLRQLEDR